MTWGTHYATARCSWNISNAIANSVIRARAMQKHERLVKEHQELTRYKRWIEARATIILAQQNNTIVPEWIIQLEKDGTAYFTAQDIQFQQQQLVAKRIMKWIIGGVAAVFVVVCVVSVHNERMQAARDRGNNYGIFHDNGTRK